jgi:hypothetical protein
MIHPEPRPRAHARNDSRGNTGSPTSATVIEELERASLFWRIIHEASAGGSDRRIVEVCAETLAVWSDLEVCGYVRSQGVFQRTVALPGAHTANSPRSLEVAALRPWQGVLWKTVADAERLGFGTGRELVMKRVGSGRGSWLITASGERPLQGVPALAMCLGLLDNVMPSARAGGADRRHSVVSEPLRAGFRAFVEPAAARALAEGTSVTLLLLAFGKDVMFQSGALRDPIALIRAQMRSLDAVGLLGDREVGILLAETVETQVSAVVDRLKRLFERAGIASSVRVGIASRTPADPDVLSLVEDARNFAALLPT